jgi:protein SCO1
MTDLAMFRPVRFFSRRLVLLAVLLGLSGCGGAEEAPPAEILSAPSAAGASGSALPDLSVYQLEGQWRDQHGEERALVSLRGRPQIAAMVYTHCGYTCPQILLDMKRIEAQLQGSDAGFLLVSIDPQRDTPERLAQFASAARLDPQRWTLLTGSEDQTLELAMVLGVSYRPEGDADLSHSNALIVLDPQGQVVLKQEGLAQDPAAILEAIAGM